MHRWRIHASRCGAALTALLVLATACSGDDDGASPTLASAPTTVTPSTSSTPSSTSAPASTSSVASTSTSDTSTPTTAPPSSTLPEMTIPPTTTPPTTAGESTSTTLPEGVPPRVTFPDNPESQAIADAIYRYSDALLAAQAEPNNSELVDHLIAATTGQRQVGALQLVDELVAGSWAFVENPDQPSYLDIVAPTLAYIDDSATVDACAVAAEMLVSVDPTSGQQSVVDDAVESGFITVQLRRVDGTWRVASTEPVGQFEAGVICD